MLPLSWGVSVIREKTSQRPSLESAGCSSSALLLTPAGTAIDAPVPVSIRPMSNPFPVTYFSYAATTDVAADALCAPIRSNPAIRRPAPVILMCRRYRARPPSINNLCETWSYPRRVSARSSSSKERSSWSSVASSTRWTPVSRLSQPLISAWVRRSRRESSPTSRRRLSRRSLRRSNAGHPPRVRRQRHGGGERRRRHGDGRGGAGGAEERHLRLRAHVGRDGDELQRRVGLGLAAHAQLVERPGIVLGGRAQDVAQLRLDLRRVDPRRTWSAGRYSQLASTGRRGSVRTKRPTIWRKIIGVFAAVA